MEVTRVVATRSTCLRRQVGAIVVKQKRILSTGYNGAPMGLSHCAETGCLRQQMGIPSGERQELCRGLHAEQNAIIQASQHGTSLGGGTLYTTLAPCLTCAKMIINAGIERVIYQYAYPDPMALDFLRQAGVVVERRPERTDDVADRGELRRADQPGQPA
jgi:dCMP deaminase